MGSYIECNDTLQITSDQGFPLELDIHMHLKKPFDHQTFKDRIFEFKNKPSIRIYHRPPVRNFLVQNIDGKWIYWGMIHILSVNHDYINGTTSGTYKIIYINTPDEMKLAHHLMDQNTGTNYFS
jgi:hypothetical protein